MKPSELYSQAIENYRKAVRLKNMTLRDYCKEHHLKYNALQHWMSRNSITVAELKGVTPKQPDSFSDNVVIETKSGKQIYPLSFPMSSVQDGYVCNRFLKGVNITFPDGVIVSIKEISREDLNNFIHSYNTH